LKIQNEVLTPQLQGKTEPTRILLGALHIGLLFLHGSAGPVGRNKSLNQNGCKLTKETGEVKSTVYIIQIKDKIKLITISKFYINVTRFHVKIHKVTSQKKKKSQGCESSTRMGDLLGSPRERVSYLAYPNLFGTKGLEEEEDVVMYGSWKNAEAKKNLA
jgi:hypothetical protein